MSDKDRQRKTATVSETEKDSETDRRTGLESPAPSFNTNSAHDYRDFIDVIFSNNILRSEAFL